MRTETKRTITVTLEMDENEANWLMGYLQNSPLGLDEPREDGDIRKAMFKSLQGSLTQRARPAPPVKPPQINV